MKIAELLLRFWEELCRKPGWRGTASRGWRASDEAGSVTGWTKNLDARFSLDIAPKAKF